VDRRDRPLLACRNRADRPRVEAERGDLLESLENVNALPQRDEFMLEAPRDDLEAKVEPREGRRY